MMVYVRGMTLNPEDLITRADAAERAGVNPRTIDNWRRAGLLSTYAKRGGDARIYVSATEVDRQTAYQKVPAQRSGS